MRRYSRKREAILNAIRLSGTHPTAELIYSQLKPQFPDLSLATVYRNINEFVSDGVVSSIGVVDSKEHFDRNTAPHSHFVCKKCGAIIDVFSLTPDLKVLTRDLNIGSVTGFQVTLQGICNDCLEANENTKTQKSL